MSGDRRYYISTWGCQMNVHDSERMAGMLEMEGFIETDNLHDADIVVFNTCSIRRKAEEKFYSELGRVKSLKRKKPFLKVAVAGCVAQQEGAALIEKRPYVDFVIGPQNLHAVQSLVIADSGIVATQDNHALAELELPAVRKDRVRAWVTIMYGCNNYCSYCVVPYTRGRERSRPSANILAEVRQLAAKGFKEVTLLGQNVNSYRSDRGFPALLREISSVEGITRIRFVTSHPKDLSEDLVDAMAELGNVCEHIHLPLQSGSTSVLALMNRRYTFDDYRAKVDLLRQRIPGIAITTDIIAGFPRETADDHAATVRALREIEFDGIFAFRFSPRPGTRAATMEGQLPEETKAARLEEILRVQDEITERRNRFLEGTLQEVLLEGGTPCRDGQMTGRTRTNKIVNIPVSEGKGPGSSVTVKIIRANRHSLFGAALE